MKSKIMKALTLCMALFMCISCAVSVSAAEPDSEITIDPSNVPTIVEDAECSLTIYKYDWSNAVKDGIWNEDSFISTGWQESYIEEILGGAVREGDANGESDHALGNGQTSYGYALAGVEFTLVRVADIVTYSEVYEDQGVESYMTQVLYGFEKESSADLLAAIGLANGAERYEAADSSDDLDSTNYYYYTSDTLNKALADAMADNSTTVKNAMEAFVSESDAAVVMEKTNEYGKAYQDGLSTGLWICVESAVPEMVTSTTPGFFLSLPMTSVSGDENSGSPEGGHVWNYNPVVYPKQETGIPTLTKEIRESASESTGKNNGTDAIDDGFAHNATGSAGDVMEYQILSIIGTITSKATSFKMIQFYDSICEGLTYNKDRKDVKIEIFTDKDCTDKVTTWVQDDGKFDVTYSDDNRHMTINITDAGLAEINGDTENVNGKLYVGYSNYTIRITYTATINSDTSFVYGQEGNDNKVIMTWKRTSSDYYDTLIDDAHCYSFGMDITKLFSDKDPEAAENDGLYEHVKFKVYNETDGYWVTAKLNETEGIYYVTGHVEDEADATIFEPVTMGTEHGHIMLKGCEDDEYYIVEQETANGYTKLKEPILVKITANDDTSRPCDIYSKDVLGVLQNDPHYSFDGGQDLTLANIPQEQLAHNYMTATAVVDGEERVMLEDDGSANAEAPVPVKNTRGFDLPQTGDVGTWMFTVGGIVLMAGALLVIFFVCRKKSEQ